MIHFVAGAVVGLSCLVGGTLLEGGDLRYFINIPSLLITVGGTLGACMMVYSPGAILRALRTSTSGAGTEAHRREARRVWNMANWSLLAFGAIGFITGFIHAAGNLADMERFGAGLATALLAPFYAFVLRALCVNPLRERVTTEESSENQEQTRHLRAV